MLYSFDVFDTLITRKVATPKGIFALMQQELLTESAYQEISSYVRENFYELRIHAEELARHYFQKNGIEDVTLEQIYETLGTSGSLTDEELSVLQTLEEKIEIENAVGISKNIAIVKKLLSESERVILISDMYLPAKVIRKLLTKADKIFANIPLYVSSEYRQSKYTGKLFAIISKKEKIEYNNWHHMGDNSVSDVKNPRMLGIKAEVPFQMVLLLPIEKWLLNGRENDLYLQRMIGAARLFRNVRGVLNGPLAIGTATAGPILISYVRWIVDESLRRGFKRLYFIARDAYILQQMADIIIEKENLPIETFYLYGSRRAWRFPSYDGRENSLITLLKWAYPQKVQSVKAFAELLQVKTEDLIPFLPKEYQEPGAELSFLVVSAIIKDLDSREEFRNWFLEKQKESRLLAVQYLQQEIDVSDENFAFVELGGGGLSQSCMANLMADFYTGRVKTFFFKMDSVNCWANCDFYNFLPSFLESNLVIEMICRAGHGQTERYIKKGEKIVPVLKEGEGEAIIAHGYLDYIEGILGFTKEYIKSGGHMGKCRLDLILKYMEYITVFPDEEILDFFAEMPNSLIGNEKKVYGFAPKLTKDDLREIYLFHGNEYCPWDRYYNGTEIIYGLRRLNGTGKKRLDKYNSKRWIIFDRFRRLWKQDLGTKRKITLFEGVASWLRGKVVIYGAGEIGKNIYAMLKNDGVNVVAWLDKDFAKLQKQGVPVTGKIDGLKELVYDTIIVAIKNKGTVEKVVEELLFLGVKKERIYRVEDVWGNYLLV